jgi:protein-disulfide isomerase
MRLPRAVVLLTLTLLLAVTGCSRNVSGSAVGDLNPPLVEITGDQFGIRAGLEDAPVQLELYTEPQCTHCAELQKDFGDEFAYYISTGQLAITYRPLTFLDTPSTEGHSGRVVNALFAAASPGGDPEDPSYTTGRQFQRFVEELWANQEPGGVGPTDEELADFARDAKVPVSQTHQIEQGAHEKSDTDLADMESTNFEFLYEVDPINTGTPTVFDLIDGEKIDIYDNDWLSKLMES